MGMSAGLRKSGAANAFDGFQSPEGRYVRIISSSNLDSDPSWPLTATATVPTHCGNFNIR
jgi:hypothetical protein